MLEYTYFQTAHYFFSIYKITFSLIKNNNERHFSTKPHDSTDRFLDSYLSARALADIVSAAICASGSPFSK